MVALFVVITIAFFLIIDMVLQKLDERKGLPSPLFSPARALKAIPEAAREPLPLQPESFLLPRGIFYSRGHAWMRIFSTGLVRVGVDDFVQKLLGRIDGLTLRAKGEIVKAGEPLLTIHQGGREVTVHSPVEGKVEMVNREIAKHPELIRKDPYKEGWVIAIQPAHLSEDLPRLAIAERAEGWLAEEVHRLRLFLGAATPALAAAGHTLPDGGVPVTGFLEHLDDQAWKSFQDAFLSANREGR